jgi:carboxylesterase
VTIPGIMVFMPTNPDEVTVLEGAEPLSIRGGPHGALVLHGFTGSPQSMRALATALGAAGLTVELPRLPGHGTSVEDLATTTFADWSEAVEDAYAGLAARCDDVVVVGLSLGATLAAWLVTRHPEVRGLAVINGALAPMDPAVRAGLDGALAEGVTRIPAIANDIAAPGRTELAYDNVPVPQLLSVLDAVDALQPRLPEIRCPVLVIASDQDHVVPPESSARFAARVRGPVQQVALTRSFHVATLDYEQFEVEALVVDFATRVFARPAGS